jgi:acyl carrier protein
MTHEEILQIVTQIMREYFDDDEIVLTPETRADDVPAWDSMNHVNIIIGIEQRFNIRFLTSEIEGLRNVGELVNVIGRKLSAK